ncbi:MAG TPA: hypothetical protein DEA52_05845 [Clostridiaceae bacterium]|nr:hypothetical protein [Clostridiaceae bacterium]
MDEFVDVGYDAVLPRMFFCGEGEERTVSGRTMAEFQDLWELPVKISPFQKVIHPTHTVFQFTVENLSIETITFMGGTVIYEDEDGQPVKGMGVH